MARTLSQDLRDRVVTAIDSGLSCCAAAARLGVSVSSAIRWRQRALEHGKAVARPRGGDRHSGKIEAHGSFIRELIAEQGDMTLVEVQARLIERGATVGIGTVHRFFARHGIADIDRSQCSPGYFNVPCPVARHGPASTSRSASSSVMISRFRAIPRSHLIFGAPTTEL